MAQSLSHSIYAKIQEKGNILSTKSRYTKIIKDLCKWKGIEIIE